MEKNITPINQLSWKDRLKSYKKHPGSFILLLLVGASAVITVTVLVYLVGYILIHGVPYVVFRDSVALGIFHVSWCGNACNHGSTGHYENDGGSAFVCAGYVP